MVPVLLVAGAAGIAYATAEYAKLSTEEKAVLNARVTRWVLRRVGLDEIIMGSEKTDEALKKEAEKIKNSATEKAQAEEMIEDTFREIKKSGSGRKGMPTSEDSARS